jgi:transcriptional repressor NrdR
MLCPYCRNPETKVTDKRSSDEDKSIRRRRECLKCTKRFSTYERIENIDLFVVKKDNTRQRFDSEKVRQGMLRSCEKRPVSMEQIDNSVERVEAELRRLKNKEVKSSQVGEKVMRELKKLDNVSYIRFASIYRDFKDVEDFEKEIKQIK